MFLTKVKFDVEDAKTIRDFNNLQELHKTIQSLFVGDRGSENVLYMIKPSRSELIVYIQSTNEPRFDPAKHQHMEVLFCRDNAEHMKEVLSSKRPIQFMMTCCPVKTKAVRGSRGVRTLLVSREDRCDWVIQKLRGAGCEVLACDEVGTNSNIVNKDGLRFTVHGTTYSGVFACCDPFKTMRFLEQGIGPEKAYGCGLMLIA